MSTKLRGFEPLTSSVPGEAVCPDVARENGGA
jgi:hypothetical protein